MTMRLAHRPTLDEPVDPAVDDVPRSIGRVLDVLEVVVRRGPINLAAVAAATDLTPTTALRHLRALVTRDYVGRDERGAFSPGPALRHLAGVVVGAGGPASLVDVCRPVLAELAEVTGESAYLAVSAGDEAVYVATAESKQPLRHAGWVGRTVPLDGTAVGAALRGSPGTTLRRGGVEPGVTAIAHAVRVGTEIVAALVVIGPSHRLRRAEVAVCRAAIGAAANRVGVRLAGVA